MERHERIEEPAGPALPEDFAARLGRLEDLSGLSLEEFARSAGLPESRFSWSSSWIWMRRGRRSGSVSTSCRCASMR